MHSRRSPRSTEPLTLPHLRRQLRAAATPEKAAQALRFFKTGPGEYGEGDRFLGLTVPDVRAQLRHTDGLAESDLLSLLTSPWHEERLLALLALGRRFARARGDQANATRDRIVDLYLSHTRHIDNWDLVDSSAPYILGPWLLDRDRRLLDQLTASASLWEQRIAVLATFAFIRAGQFEDTLRLCTRLLGHPHDLMHKACGWMLRELGKRSLPTLLSFLDAHASTMPRTMLRYAIERLPEPRRQRYLAAGRGRRREST